MKRLHPKVLAAFLGGVTSTAVIAVASAFGVHVPTDVAASVATACATLAGWLRSSGSDDVVSQTKG